MTGYRLTALACVCALALLAVPAPALAQTDTAQNATAPNEPSTEVADQLGDLVIHSYSYSDGTMTIEATWRGPTPETITLTEMIELDSEGTTSISFQTQRLLPNERTKLTIDAETRTGGTAAVLVTTPQGTEMNEALVLQAGKPSEPDTLIPQRNAILGAGIAAAGAAALTFVFVLRRKHEEEQEVDRLA
ncbi:hypothetical protein GRX03_11935 [Halovenus sp. WSH3]|uniref:Uncharacterized protein n=1 Tax=Halovenus carboxidivorans TaxID=2692199 RepID=A0A6B0TGK0_9EURY|nr:hypothetical protein [Halovenus carboxidivorans]MXR52309.1 hypothetical protein [Halovenus carboxidivorans]